MRQILPHEIVMHVFAPARDVARAIYRRHDERDAAQEQRSPRERNRALAQGQIRRQLGKIDAKGWRGHARRDFHRHHTQ